MGKLVAPLIFAFVKSVPVMVEPEKSTFVSVAPVKDTPDRVDPENDAPAKLTPVKFVDGETVCPARAEPAGLITMEQVALVGAL